jgi:uncharacterized membrane protein YgdD (TMEM256/DUF423 family)
MFLRVAALSGASAVLLGAFGAHALQRFTSDPKQLATFATASHYHLLHSAVLLFAAQSRKATSCALLTAGIVVFSGSLYLLVLTQKKWLGAITPIGGLLLTAGWAALLL